MDLKALLYGIRLLIGAWAVCLATGAGAQESLDHGKSPAQLFASDCSICHKSPQGLAKSGGLLGLDSFLREHYTASWESAIAIANYLKSMEGPAAPGRASKRTAKGDEKAKADEKEKAGSQARRGKGDREIRCCGQRTKSRRPNLLNPSLPTPSLPTPSLQSPPKRSLPTLWLPSRSRSDRNPVHPRPTKQSPPGALNQRSQTSAGARRSRLFGLLLPFAFWGFGRRLAGFRSCRLCGHGAFRFLATAASLRSLRLEHGFRSGSCRSSFLFRLCAPDRHVLTTRDAWASSALRATVTVIATSTSGMQRQRHLILADRLDRRVEHDLRAVRPRRRHR